MNLSSVNVRFKRICCWCLPFLSAILLSYCGGQGGDGKEGLRADILVFAAYTVPKDVYQQDIIPAFKRYWKEKTGRKVSFQESYMASGAQSRTIASGMEADVAALSLEMDIQRLAKKGLILHDWKKKKFNGFVTRSVVAMAFRPGNPKSVKGWADLTRADIDVIYPSPRTSGGAMWIVNAIYGAGLKVSERERGFQDPDYARELLKKIQDRVKVMDKSGRASVTTFENGFGDVLLTYENEAILRQKQGKEFPYIIPEATILIENPIALIDKNVDKHGNREVAEAFVEFVLTAEAQRSFAEFGFRPVDTDVLKSFETVFPIPGMLFDISYLGGWESVIDCLYGRGGIWSRIMRELASGR